MKTLFLFLFTLFALFGCVKPVEIEINPYQPDVNGQTFSVKTDNPDIWLQLSEPSSSFKTKAVTNHGGEEYTVCFEDNYPCFGDTDFNDAVIKYKVFNERTQTLLSNGKHFYNNKFRIEYTILACGARHNLGIGLEVKGLNRMKWTKITRSEEIDPELFFYQFDQYGLDKGNANTVIPISSDIHETLMGHEGSACLNTFNNNEVEPYTGWVEFEFKDYNYEYTPNTFNFFIMKDAQPSNWHIVPYYRVEMHTYNNKVTAKAANKGEKFNNPNQVWGIKFLGDFKYPKELISIEDAYPDFAKWLASGGTEYKDWRYNYIEDKVISQE